MKIARWDVLKRSSNVETYSFNSESSVSLAWVMLLGEYQNIWGVRLRKSDVLCNVSPLSPFHFLELLQEFTLQARCFQFTVQSAQSPVIRFFFNTLSMEIEHKIAVSADEVNRSWPLNISKRQNRHLHASAVTCNMRYKVIFIFTVCSIIDLLSMEITR